MDLLREYEFDSLAYIDKEYDHPDVQAAVHALISAEMRTFTPPNYLEHLPYPKNIERFASYTPLQPRLDTSRYNVLAPEGALVQDVSAWRKSVSNAKSQSEHQANRLMNLGVLQASASTTWLEHNECIEGMVKHTVASTNAVKRNTDSINAQRKAEQEGRAAELHKALFRRDSALNKQWQISNACSALESSLRAKGIEIKNETEEGEGEGGEDGVTMEQEDGRGEVISTDEHEGQVNKRPRMEQS